MKDYNNVLHLMDTVFEALQYMYNCKSKDAVMIKDINHAIAAIVQNIDFDYTDPPNIENHPTMEDLEKLSEWLTKLESCIQIKSETLQAPPITIYEIDRSFHATLDEIKNRGYNSVFNTIKNAYGSLSQDYRNWVQVCFMHNKAFFGSLNETENDFDGLEKRAKALCERVEDFRWLYNQLQDYRSRITLFGVIKTWYLFDNRLLESAKERTYKSYFDVDILKCNRQEVFVDLGAFTGDTVMDYVNTYGKTYKKMYVYEITPSTFNTCKANLSHLPNIEFCHKGVSDTKGEMYVDETQSSPGSNTLSAQGGTKINVVTLDDDIKEPITFIKMDIEGFEQKALAGCAAHIRANQPKLAISVYHNYEDIWKIARMIEDICPGYRFYLRFQEHNSNSVLPTEVTLTAVYR